MIRVTLITIGMAFLAAVIAWCVTLAYDQLIARISLDMSFSIIFLTFICSAIVTSLTLVIRGRKGTPG